MNRRDFIKNTSLLLLGGSCMACGGKLLYDYNAANTLPDGSKLEKKYLIEKFTDKKDLPRCIRIDACTMCQLNCPCCSRVLYPEEFKKNCGLGYLSFKNFKKLLDDNYFEYIELANMGEIFINPEIKEIIKYGHKKKVDLTAYSGTNLNYMPDDLAETLVKYKFKGMRVSIDGASPETYAQYRRGGDFNTVINNIKKINFYKKKYNSEYPIMVYKFILFGHNEHEIDKAKELAKKLDMEIFFDINFCPTFSPVKNPKLAEAKTGIINLNNQIDDKLVRYKKDHLTWFYCKQLWEMPQINWDGRFFGCCCNFTNDFGGNVFKDGLLKTLNSPKLIYAKNMVANNALPIDGIVCSDCDKYALLKASNMSITPKARGHHVTF